jgi:hypothetical protein
MRTTYMNETATKIMTALVSLQEEGKLQLDKVEVMKVNNLTYYLYNNRVKMVVEWKGFNATIL